MSEEDLAMQVGFIRASLLLRDIGDDVRSDLQRIQPAVNHEDLPDTTDELLSVALDAARSLHSNAIFAADGSCTWISPALIPGTNRFRMQPMSLNLFDGLAGVSLFLSALAKKTNESFVHELNNGTLRSITHWSENLKTKGLKDGDAGNEIPVSLPEGFGDEIFNPGLFQGVSGIGYAALHKAFPDEFPAVS
jgi:lantibiotic modifying enzyme